jgi:hypothetical protein
MEQGVARSVAILSIQRIYRDRMKQDVLDCYRRTVHGPMLEMAGQPVEHMQAFMVRQDVVREARRYLQRFMRYVSADVRTSRSFLCAYLIKFHGDFLFESAAKADEEEESLRQVAIMLIDSIDHATSPSLRLILRAYLGSFQTWQASDQPKLLGALEQEYCNMQGILDCVKEPSTQEEWLPFVTAHQERIRRHIERLGGTVSSCDRKIEASEQIAPQNPALNVKWPNVQIAHELYLNENFGFDNLVHQRLGSESLEDLEERMASSTLHDKLQLVLMIREALLDICPQKEAADINERLEVDEGAMDDFDWPGLYNYTLVLMGQYCAPERDAEVQALTKTLSYDGILKALYDMRADLANFRLRLLKQTLQTNVLVKYEQDWFAKNVQQYPMTENWLQSLHAGFRECGERHAENESLALVSYALAQLLIKDSASLTETLCLDDDRIKNWRQQFKDTLEDSVHNLLYSDSKSLGQASKECPAYRLLHKRLAELVVRACSFKRAPNVHRLGFVHQKELESLLKDVSRFFDLHVQVHGPIYDRILAKLSN